MSKTSYLDFDDQRGDFGVVFFLVFDGDVLRATSCGLYIIYFLTYSFLLWEKIKSVTLTIALNL